MRNPLFVKISIILTILSILYTYLTYIGYIRYLSIINPFSNIDKYAKDYHSLEKVNKKHRVVISMYIDKNDDFTKLYPILKSILDQTTKVDEISINISKDITRIPEFVRKYSNTYKLINNYGECNIIIPTLFREKDKDIILIILPLNYIYGQNYISDLVDFYLNEKDKLGNAKNLIVSYNDDFESSPIITQVSTFSLKMNDINYNDSNICIFLKKYIKNDTIKKIYKYKENYKYN
jgi:hypothetical protein